MRKTNKGMKGWFGILAIALFMSSGVNALTPVWTYSAPNPAQVTVSEGGTATVQYTVTNQSRKAKNLLLKSTRGLSASACRLAGKGSTCNVTLTVNGSLIPKQGIHAGPVLCEQNNPNQCYRPSAANSLNIRKISNPPAGIVLRVNGSPLTLTAGGVAGTITVTNMSASATATQISADFTGTALADNVTQDAS